MRYMRNDIPIEHLVVAASCCAHPAPANGCTRMSALSVQPSNMHCPDVAITVLLPSGTTVTAMLAPFPSAMHVVQSLRQIASWTVRTRNLPPSWPSIPPQLVTWR